MTEVYLSRMAALIISAFPGMTPDYIFNKLSFQQFFLWHDRATEVKTGNMINRNTEKVDPDDIKNKFVWNEDLKKWVAKNG